MRSPESIYSAPAAADYSATVYRFGKIDTNGNIATCVAGDQAQGVIENAPAANEQARIQWDGTLKIEVGTGGLTAGAKVYSDANGKAITGDATAGHFWMGIAVAAYAAGDVGLFVWSPGQN